MSRGRDRHEELNIRTETVMLDAEFLRTRDGIKVRDGDDLPDRVQMVKDSRGRTRGKYERNEQQSAKPQEAVLQDVKCTTDRSGKRIWYGEYKPVE